LRTHRRRNARRRIKQKQTSNSVHRSDHRQLIAIMRISYNDHSFSIHIVSEIEVMWRD
jgi:hypothetical protein